MSIHNQAAGQEQNIEYAAYVGLDVHKETISVALAEMGHGDPEYRGEISNTPEKVRKLNDQLSERFQGQRLLFSYEAGPCGYGIYHRIKASGHESEVVAPSLSPRKAGDRIKTDRRDAVMLVRLSRSSELTAVWVPTREQEAIRNLSQPREDMKVLELKTRQRLSAFLLRHEKRYPGKSRWTQAFFRWLSTLSNAQLPRERASNYPTKRSAR